MERAILVIPAYNEEEFIGNTVRQALELARQGIIEEIVVVADHCTDQTAQIANRCGATVIEQQISPERGKGEAFLQGLLYVKNKGADVILTLDADLTSQYSQYHVSALMDALKKPLIDMTVYPVRDGDSFCGWHYSGQRAIRLSALNFLFKENPDSSPRFVLSEIRGAMRFRELASGYGLEVALNKQLPKKIRINADENRSLEFNELEFAPLKRRKELFSVQGEDINQTVMKIRARLSEKGRLLAARKN